MSPIGGVGVFAQAMIGGSAPALIAAMSGRPISDVFVGVQVVGSTTIGLPAATDRAGDELRIQERLRREQNRCVRHLDDADQHAFHPWGAGGELADHLRVVLNEVGLAASPRRAAR